MGVVNVVGMVSIVGVVSDDDEVSFVEGKTIVSLMPRPRAPPGEKRSGER